MTSGKDSDEVAQFLTLFAQLKGWVDDDPAALPFEAANDDPFWELCDQVRWAARRIQANERRRRELFTGPVDPRFVAAWRDYEARYEPVLARLWLTRLLARMDCEPTSAPPPSARDREDIAWENADYDAGRQAKAIHDAIDFAQENESQEWRWPDLGEQFVDGLLDGYAAWQRLGEEMEFDLRGIFRRRALIPFVLVPPNVAKHYGQADPLSMLRNLQQAHEAFVFGAPLAALALMRSTMEAVLRDHYEASGAKLDQRINNARRLPKGAERTALHRLRKLANAVLHLDADANEDLPPMDEAQLEKEIVALLFVLRALIEGAR